MRLQLLIPSLWAVLKLRQHSMKWRTPHERIAHWLQIQMSLPILGLKGPEMPIRMHVCHLHDVCRIARWSIRQCHTRTLMHQKAKHVQCYDAWSSCTMDQCFHAADNPMVRSKIRLWAPWPSAIAGTQVSIDA